MVHVALTVLENSGGTVADETVTGLKTWVKLDLAPGQYRVTVRAAVGGKAVAETAAVVVKPGELAAAEVTLPV